MRLVLSMEDALEESDTTLALDILKWLNQKRPGLINWSQVQQLRSVTYFLRMEHSDWLFDRKLKAFNQKTFGDRVKAELVQAFSEEALQDNLCLQVFYENVGLAIYKLTHDGKIIRADSKRFEGRLMKLDVTLKALEPLAHQDVLEKIRMAWRQFVIQSIPHVEECIASYYPFDLDQLNLRDPQKYAF